MSTNQLFIPSKIKVGFQNRRDTYTQRLAYIIYYDHANILRKEKSWQSWRDSKIEPLDFTNEPTEGFVLNKGVGGVRQSYGWNARNEYIRVYDPRNFEFEISVANLLFILRECDCSKGKGLEGKFVYAWDKTELVLLPVISEDYKNSQVFTGLQGKEIKAKELIEGATYTTRKQQILVYLGKRNVHHVISNCDFGKKSAVTKEYVFWNGEKFDLLKDVKKLAACVQEVPVPNYAELVDKYWKSAVGSKPVAIYLKQTPKDSNTFSREEQPGVFLDACMRSVDGKEIDHICVNGTVRLDGNVLRHVQNYRNIYKSAIRRGYTPAREWIEPTNQSLFVRLESGSEFLYSYGGLIPRDDSHGED